MTGLETYFSSLQRVFDTEAHARGGPDRFDYHIANHRIRLNFASHALVAKFTPALGHLQGSFSEKPALEIDLWDEVSASSPMPPPPWSWENYLSRGEIGGFETVRYRAWFHVASGILSMIDLEDNRGILWVRDPDVLPMYSTAAPVRMLLQAWLSQRGLQFAHAAAVGSKGGAVLLAGQGGAGKSTTSLACLDAGMDFISDDYCLIASEPKPRVHSVYCSAKMDKKMLPRFPALSPAVQKRNDPPGEKALLLLDKLFSRQLIPSLPLRALLLPVVSDQDVSSLEPVTALDGIRALAPSTLQQISGPDPEAWRTITSLARKLPSFQLRLGRDPGSTPALICDLLDNLS